MALVRFRLLRNVGFGLLTTLLVVTSTITFLTYHYRNATPANTLFHWAIQNHLIVVTILVILSVAFGFALSYLSGHELSKKERESKSVLDVVMLFLNADEKRILHYLVEQSGKATQAEISRLEGMDRVKAFRTVQKMTEKNLITVEAHGKVRKVQLKEGIYELLKQ